MANNKHHIASNKLTQHLRESLKLLKCELSAVRGKISIDDQKEIEYTIVQQLAKLKREASILTNQPMRTIHHLACTGGTLISKCIAALPNVQLLSEIDPLSTLQHSNKPMFGPTDLIKQWRQGSRGASKDDIIELFLAEMKAIMNLSMCVGQNVVIRDHSHSHFNSGTEIPQRPNLRNILQRAFDVRSVVTVRHPADSYASLVKNGWHKHFQPSDFEEYCKRYLIFIENYSDCFLIKYEDFVKEPQSTVKKIADELMLTYDESFQLTFSAVKLTGDSGRKFHKIVENTRQETAAKFESIGSESAVYQNLINYLKY